MSERSTRLSRRNFLLTVGAGGAATATAAAVVATKKSTSGQSRKDKRATQGYQATEHVNNYYRTAKV